MVSIFDKCLYLYPNIQNISYWYTQYDGTEWEDPYDGLVWNNTEIPKPTKEELLALDENIVAAELALRTEETRKNNRDQEAKNDLGLKLAYNQQKNSNPELTWRQFLDSIENMEE